MGAHTELAANVLVLDEAGNAILLEAGSAVPEWAEDQVGDHCYAAAASEDTSEPAGDPEDEDPAGGDADPGVEPPRNGPGSGTAAWAAFAKANGFDVPDESTKADIIAALVDGKVIAE